MYYLFILSKNMLVYNREQLWPILKNFEIPLKLARLIRNCNENTMFQVRFINEMSKGFEVKTDLRQEYTLSPVLINLKLEI